MPSPLSNTFFALLLSLCSLHLFMYLPCPAGTGTLPSGTLGPVGLQGQLMELMFGGLLGSVEILAL